METRKKIKTVFILAILIGLILIKLFYSELNTYTDLALDGIIAIFLLAIGQQAIFLALLLPLQFYLKINRLFKDEHSNRVD